MSLAFCVRRTREVDHAQKVFEFNTNECGFVIPTGQMLVRIQRGVLVFAGLEEVPPIQKKVKAESGQFLEGQIAQLRDSKGPVSYVHANGKWWRFNMRLQISSGSSVASDFNPDQAVLAECPASLDVLMQKAIHANQKVVL